jgi:hypothetical protein
MTPASDILSAPMRWNVLPALSLLMALTACGAAPPPVEDPESTDDTPSGKKGDTEALASDPSALSSGSDRSAVSRGADPVVGVTVKDETMGKALPCTGASIPDLATVLAQASCEVANAKPDEAQRDVKDQLEIAVATDAPRVAPGAAAKITVTYHNKGKTPLSLDFAADPEPRFDFEVYSLKGSRMDKPVGAAPPLPPEVQNAPEPDKSVARVTLAPNGTAKLTQSWTAIKYKWASKDKAKGALPGRGYPRDAAGPLPKGKYVLRVITPLVGVSEGGDHEWSQPRTQVEVGGP